MYHNVMAIQWHAVFAASTYAFQLISKRSLKRTGHSVVFCFVMFLIQTMYFFLEALYRECYLEIFLE